ncbi:SusE domain-containing protein [Desertivirga brevis]|uniref:SusE domain-containing protein n=1 Tax=Desertivirga brevis TaxID=2810310 RepID=UPI001A9697BE|nr:SusE domain-containing protein [Pedobacter sp. SYSU D00873]
MKSVIKVYSMALLLMLLAIVSCKEDTTALNENLSTVGSLSLPADQTSIELKADNTPLLFQWTEAVAEDGDKVLYEIAFDRENGDFSNPVYKVLSNGNGVQPQKTLFHTDLIRIAAMLGIPSAGTGKVKWTVLASKGTNRKLGSVSRTMTLKRPEGLAEIPAELYITGSATEAGEDITKALKLKNKGDGQFEIFTSLKAGTYYLTDKPGAGGKKFYIENGKVKEGDSPITVAGPTKVYRLNFNAATVLQTEIQSIGLYQSAYNAEKGQLTYKGNGVWEVASMPVEFFPFSWGRDERYKFILHTSSGLEYWGSSKPDNVSPGGQPASYFFLEQKTSDQWANTYKFAPAADNKNVKVTVNFGAGAEYTHEVTVL